jgi:hypothetical protein
MYYGEGGAITDWFRLLGHELPYGERVPHTPSRTHTNIPPTPPTCTHTSVDRMRMQSTHAQHSAFSLRTPPPIPFPPFFSSTGINVADFILDLANGDSQTVQTQTKKGQLERHAVEGPGAEEGQGAAADRKLDNDGEAARLRLVKSSEAFLAAHPQGFEPGLGGDVLVMNSSDGSPLSSDEATATALPDSAAATPLGGMTPVGSVQDMETLRSRRSSSGRVLQRSATSLAAERPGASRWGASFLTQLKVRERGAGGWGVGGGAEGKLWLASRRAPESRGTLSP